MDGSNCTAVGAANLGDGFIGFDFADECLRFDGVSGLNGNGGNVNFDDAFTDIREFKFDAGCLGCRRWCRGRGRDWGWRWGAGGGSSGRCSGRSNRGGCCRGLSFDNEDGIAYFDGLTRLYEDFGNASGVGADDFRDGLVSFDIADDRSGLNDIA
jgi:hypothetical protein